MFDKMKDKNIKKRFEKEAESFDRISIKRKMHHQIPDMRVEFVNEYFYNNIWRKGVFLREEYGPLCNWIIKSLRRVKVHSVIELGCGNGWLCLELARAGFKVTGLDISKKSIKIAQDYLNSLNEKDELSLNYSCENILDYDRYLGESVVCFGFLHHLPSQALRKVISYMWKKMKAGQLLLVLEPRYEYASYEMSALIYALRLALPNHFKYKNISSDAISHLKEIFDELSEAHKTQSVMDKESSSDMIEKIIKQNFAKVNIQYCTSFFDKVIGSIRVKDEDVNILSKLLKQLDDIIVKYNHKCSRTIKIKAEKEIDYK